MMLVCVAGAFILFAWGLFNPFAGLVGLLVINTIAPGELYPALGSLHLERTMAIVVLASLLFHQGQLAFPRVTKLLLFFWLTMFVGIPFAFWKFGSLQFTIDFGKTVIYHLLIVGLVNTQRRFRAFLVVFVLLVGWLAASSYIGFLQGHVYMDYDVHGGIARVTGGSSAAGDSNVLGLTCVSSLPLIALLMLRGLWRDRLLGVAVGALSIFTLVFTGSRSAFLALVFLLAAYTFSSGKRVLFLPLALAFLAILWLSMPTEYQQRYLSVNDRDHDASYQYRLHSWRGGWHMFLDHPVTGVGAGGYANANGVMYWPEEGQKHYVNAHSLYLQLIAELGLLGTSAFCVYLFSLFRLNRSLSKELSLVPDAPSWLRFYPVACSLSLAVMLFGGYSGHSLYRTQWYVLGALSGCVQMLVGQLKGQLPVVSRQSSENSQQSSTRPGVPVVVNFRRKMDSGQQLVASSYKAFAKG